MEFKYQIQQDEQHEEDNNKLNLINKNFENELNSNFYHRFMNFMIFDEVFENHSNLIELELLNYFNRNSNVTGQWFSNLFKDYISKPKVLINFLKILAKLENDKIPNSHLFVASLLINNDIEIKDFAIRVFESWGDLESLKILENTARISPEWLENYKQSVIKNLRKNLV